VRRDVRCTHWSTATDDVVVFSLQITGNVITLSLSAITNSAYRWDFSVMDNPTVMMVATRKTVVCTFKTIANLKVVL